MPAWCDLGEFIVECWAGRYRVAVGIVAQLGWSSRPGLAEEDGAGDASRRGPPGIVKATKLHRTPLILGDGLRAAMDALLAGFDIELTVETELNDHETIRLMVAEGAGAAVLPLSSVSRECARGILEAHRITEASDVPHTSPGMARPACNASLARDAGDAGSAMVEEMEAEGRHSDGREAAGAAKAARRLLRLETRLPAASGDQIR